MNVNKISTVEAIALVIIITINRLTVSLPQTILIPCGSSSILNVIYVSIIAILFSCLLVKLFKRFTASDIIDVSEFLGGKFLKNLVGIILVTYIIFISFILLRDFSEVLHILYYSDTPVIFILLFFIFVCIVSNLLGSRSILKTNVVICIIMLIGIFISCMTIIPDITIERIFPILGNGTYQTFVAGITNIFAFNGLIILYLVPPMLKDKKDFKKVSLISTIVSGFLILLSIIVLLLPFAFSTKIPKIAPFYLLISNNQFGKYFQHPESFFAFTWILSIMTYLNFSCMLLLQIIKKLTNIKNEKPLLIPLAIIFFVIAIIPKNIMQARQWGLFVYKFIAGPLFFILLPIILIFANLKYKKLHKNDYDVLEE